LSGANARIAPQIEFATCGKLLSGPLARHESGLLHPVPQGNHPVRDLARRPLRFLAALFVGNKASPLKLNGHGSSLSILIRSDK
jgi:hypothetical protein